ncbi:Uncharacterised protein [Serratia plymuthica]|uniref:Retron-type reverse transcriptase n=1 Tax=Serratia plymuthica TaxID=82996 RepID=A0A2X4U5Q3_SERPL|nr:Uncharacterised protein [Serratia plymuthica]
MRTYGILRFHWAQQEKPLWQQLQNGHYRLAPMQVLRRGGRSWVQWCALDALILKWAALLAEPLLPKPARCMHLRGHGGSVVSAAEVRAALAGGEYAFVYRTDIRGYYRHIRKQQVISQLKWHVADPVLFDVIQQYVHYSVEDGGEFYTPQKRHLPGLRTKPVDWRQLVAPRR